MAVELKETNTGKLLVANFKRVLKRITGRAPKVLWRGQAIESRSKPANSGQMKSMTQLLASRRTNPNQMNCPKRCRAWAVLSAFLSAASALTSAPANDNFANAVPISPGVTSGSNVEATREAGEPEAIILHDNPGTRVSIGSKTVWWRWTAPASGQVNLATASPEGPEEEQSSFDTQLGVYTGSLGSLNEVASNEDSSNPGIFRGRGRS